MRFLPPLFHCHPDRPGHEHADRPARRRTDTRADRQTVGHREAAPVDRRRRAQGHGADARRHAHGDRHLPAEGHVEEVCRSIFVRTPYNFNFWDVRNGVAARHDDRARRRSSAATRTSSMNERGHFFSEGNYDILGAPPSDGDDAMSWMATQPWSNGKVGTIGCSSTAEWQMAVAALGNPALCGDERRRASARASGRVGPVLRAGQLVSRRRGADAVHRLALRRAEPGAPHVPARTRRRRI